MAARRNRAILRTSTTLYTTTTRTNERMNEPTTYNLFTYFFSSVLRSGSTFSLYFMSVAVVVVVVI